jgi:DnaJ-domain-containing protein 1
MSENKIEELTAEEFYANVAASISAVNARASAPGQPPKFHELMKEAAEVLQESYQSESHTFINVSSFF